MSPEREAELKAIIEQMQNASDIFYAMAQNIGNHAFIEFTGLMNEYIKICQTTLQEGVDFTECNTHTGLALSHHAFQVTYLAEKLDCIYGKNLSHTVMEEAENHDH